MWFRRSPFSGSAAAGGADCAHGLEDGNLACSSGPFASRRGAGAKPHSALGRPTFSAFLAERQFSRDLAFALWLPLVLAAFAARSCNAPGAAPGTCEAGRDRGLALSSFPCGAAPIAQLLHVLRHLPWYLLVRPVRVGDWAGLLSNAHHLAFTGLVLVLAAAPRQGRLWDWWKRHRVLAAWSTARGGCTLLHLASYPLLPRARWPDAVFGPYTILVSTHTLTTTLIYCALDLFMGFPFLAASAAIVLHTGAVLAAAHVVAPRILDVECGGSVSSWGHTVGNSSSSSSNGDTGARCKWLKCHAPSHRQLLCCRPVWQQALLAAAMVALPLTLAALSQRWLWGCYVTALRRREQKQREAQPQQQERQQEGVALARAQEPQGQHDGDEVRRQQEQEEMGGRFQQPQRQEVGQQQHLARKPLPMLCLPAPRRALAQSGPPEGRSAMYQGVSTGQSLSVKVLEHPGSYEQFAPRLLAAVEQVVRGTGPEQHRQHRHQPHQWQGHSMAAPNPTIPSAAAIPSDSLFPTMSPALHSCVVLRGCTHVWMWSGGILVPSHAASSPDAGGIAAQQLQQQEDTPLLAGEAAPRALVSRVVGALPDPDQLVGVWVQVADAHGCRVMNAAQMDGGMQVPREAVQLLRLCPPALALPTRGLEGQGEGEGEGEGQGQGDEAGGGTEANVEQQPGRLSLVVQSLASQAARLVVVRQQRGGEEEASGAVLRRGVVVAEFPLQLAEGVQEVGVDLAGAVREVVGSSEAEVLQVLLLPPHDDGFGGGGGGGSVGGGGSGSDAPLPLVHFSAPLLLLPTDAASELRQYEADVLQTAAEEGAAAEEGEHAGRGAAAAPAGAAAAAAPAEGVAAEGVPSEGVAVAACQRWGRAMVPLLRDLAMVVVANSYARTSTGSREGLGAGAGTEVVGGGGNQGGGNPGNGQEGVGWGASGHEAVRAAIMPGLLAFLRDNAMDSLAALLEAAPGGGSTEAAGAASAATTRPGGALEEAAAVAAATSTSGALSESALPPPNPVTPSSSSEGDSSTTTLGGLRHNSTHSTSSQPPGGGGGGGGSGQRTDPASCATCAAGTATAPAACGAPQPTMPTRANYPTAADILLGFRPPAQERCFQDWRAAGLLRAAVPLMLLAAVPHAYAVVCYVVSLLHLPQLPRVGATGTGVSRAWGVAAVVAFFAFSFLADAAGYLAIMVTLHMARRRRRARNSQAEQQRQQQPVACQEGGSASAYASGAVVSNGRGLASGATRSGPQQHVGGLVGRSMPAARPVVSVALGRPYVFGALVVAPGLQLLITSLMRLMPHTAAGC